MNGLPGFLESIKREALLVVEESFLAVLIIRAVRDSAIYSKQLKTTLKVPV